MGSSAAFKSLSEITSNELPLTNKQLEAVNKLAEDGVDLHAVVTIQKEKSVTVKSDFVLAFTDNLEHLASLNIKPTELKVICQILKIMEYGNLINLNQRKLCHNLNMKPSNMSMIFKSLKAKQIIIEDEDKNLFMNSKLFQKGLKQNLSADRNNHLKAASKNLIDEHQQELVLDDTF